MRSLRSRIALAYAALIVLAMGALGIMLLRGEQRRYRDELDARLLAEARLVSEAVAPILRAHRTVEAVDPMAKRLGQQADGRVTIIAPDGQVLGDSHFDPRALDSHAARPEIRGVLAGGAEGHAIRFSETEGQEMIYVSVPITSETGQLLAVARVAMPLSTVNNGLQGIALRVATAGAIAAGAAVALAVLIASAVTRPLQQLREAARALQHGALEQQVTVRGGAEVTELASTFNEMALRLRETISGLAQQRLRLEALLASSADGLIALDGRGVVRYMNPAAVALLGRGEGRSFAEVARHHELSGVVQEAFARGERASIPVHLARQDVWVQASASPITGGGGEWAMLLLLHDITDVRRAEITRRDFVANVSHELRTPLAGIRAVVETLRDGALHDPPAAIDFLNRVEAEVDRLVQLVEELLQLARIESGMEMHMVEVNVRDVLAACVERFQHMAERAGVALHLDAPSRPLPIRADPQRLGQAVSNLVHNAIKFTPAGGSVTVAAGQRDGRLCISVTDTGTGIDPADLPRIFERFYVADRSRAGRGTGLGLAIVKHLVRAHGGTVEAASTPGKGSVFTIELPVGR